MTGMITADELLLRLKTIALGQEMSALVDAGQYVDEYLSGLAIAPSDRAGKLASLQARFQRETPTSVRRSELLDLLSDRVVRLLEAN